MEKSGELASEIESNMYIVQINNSAGTNSNAILVAAAA